MGEPIPSRKPLFKTITCSKCSTALEFSLPAEESVKTIVQVKCFNKNCNNLNAFDTKLKSPTINSSTYSTSSTSQNKASSSSTSTNGKKPAFKLGSDENPVSTEYYDILGCSPTASAGEIKKKYYALAMQYHPDKNKSSEAEEKFKKISEAYQVLSDPKLRTRYNEFGPGKGSAPEEGFINPEELFQQQFGGDRFVDIIGELAIAKHFKTMMARNEEDGEEGAEGAEGKEKDGEVSKKEKTYEERIQEMEERRKEREIRVEKLAENLINKLAPYATAVGSNQHNNDAVTEKSFRDAIAHDAEDLKVQSFGIHLLHSVGYIYSLKASEYLSKEEFFGVTSFFHRVRMKGHAVSETFSTVKSAVDVHKTFVQLQESEKKGTFTAEEKEKLEEEAAKKGIFALWPPIPHPPWEGVRDATAYGSRCIQINIFVEIEIGNEDCLFLNVFSPMINKIEDEPKSSPNLLTTTNLLPVIVFIHGGKFLCGSGQEYSPQYFMDHNVVLVTINYRLASFGFLNTGDGLIRGNQGLKDQVLSLHWVKDNIKYFNGDPNKVTIFGQSAGGSSVQFHLISPMSKGLFHRGISMSGVALGHWTMTREPALQAIRLGERVNCPTNSTVELVQCLKSLDADILNDNHRESLDVILHERLAMFTPTVETVNDSNTFLVHKPRNILEDGKFVNKGIPWLTGVLSEEGLLYALGIMRDSNIAENLNKNWTHWAPVMFDFAELPLFKRNEVSHRIWRQYFKAGKQIDRENMYDVVDLYSDASFYAPLHEAALLQAKHGPVYLYLNSYRGNFGIFQIYDSTTRYLPLILDAAWILLYRWIMSNLFGYKFHHYGTCHADDIGIFFNIDYVTNIKVYDEDFFISKALVHQWVHFATHGKPLPFLGKEWPQVDRMKPLQLLRLDTKTEIVEEPWRSRIKLWKTISPHTL